MSGSEPALQDAELHAFVDGQLDPERHAAVAARLLQDPEAAERVRTWQTHRDALRAIFSDTLPAASQLSILRLAEARLRQRRATPWAAAAAVAIVALGLGAAGGWYLRGLPPDRPGMALSLLEQEALATHAVYSVDRRHPIEVGAVERDHLSQWLSNRLSRKIAPPDLTQAGWRLLGGRLLATERGGAAALFMYDNAQGQRLSIVVRPMATDIALPAPQLIGGAVNGAAWIDGGLGYAVVAPASKDELSEISKLVKEQSPA